MKKYILFSAVGTTDPISNGYDGSILHICRKYLPEKVVLYLSKEMLELHRKDDRYRFSIKKLADMNNTEIVGLVKQTPKILTTIYGDLAQPSVKKVGFALETVFEFSTSFLLPVKLLNEKFKLNFEKRLIIVY